MQFRRCVPNHAVLVVVLMLLSAVPARGVAEYEASVEATMTFTGTLASPILRFSGGFQDVTTDNETSGFPTFITPNGSVDVDAAARSVAVTASSLGVAPFVGGDDPADVAGMTRLAGTLGLFNPTEDFDFLVNVRVEAFFTFRGVVDSDAAERAANAVSLGFVGSNLEGLPTDGLLYSTRPSTRDDGISTSFDFVTSLFVLAIERDYVVVVPPSILTTSPGVQQRITHDLGLLAQAGGQATSLFDGPGGRALTFLPPGPELITPRDFVVPEPAGVTTLCLLGGGLLVRRRD